MLNRARRPMALLISLLLMITTAIPVLATEPPHSGHEPPDLALGRLKHATLDSDLADLAQQVSSQKQSPENAARRAGLARGELIGVTIRVADNPAGLVPWLSAHGATVANVGQQVIEAWAPVTKLEQLADRPGVLSVRSITPPMARVVSQGVDLHGAPDWSSSGYSGSGTKIGVIDVGFQGYRNLIGAELPTPVVRCYPDVGQPTAVIDNCERVTNHGTAVAETVVDVAPDATLYIANPQTALDLHDAVTWMASQGVTVINHSVGWIFEGPGDGSSVYPDGVLAAVDRAVSSGITWVNAAGNEGLSNWSGGFQDADSDRYIEFAAGDERNDISAYAGKEMIIQMRWDDTWAGAQRDLDLYLVDADNKILAAGEMQQDGRSGDTPFEKLRFIPNRTVLGGDTGTLYLEIRHFDGPAPRWIQLQAFSGEQLQVTTASYSLSNPGESANTGLLAVGAASWQTPNIVEPFSSQGPSRDGRIKPDLTGIDGADTATYGPSGFVGTSQAAPHVAGLAALVRQRYPSFGPVDVANYLRATATGYGGAIPNNMWGYGLAHLPDIDSATGYARPVITGIDPATRNVGSDPFTLTVNGADFAPGSVVRWNGQDRATTYVSSSRLHIAVTDDEIALPGTVEIVVYSPSTGESLSNTVTLSIVIPDAPDYEAFERIWERTDYPVQQLAVGRTWMWGDGPASGPIAEEYAEAPGGTRTVKYYDKSRMEINDPNAPQDSIWFVTNGLLVVELMTGRMQVGDAAFEQRSPASVNVAGDPGSGPTYATFAGLMDDAPLSEGTPVIQRANRYGSVTLDRTFERFGVTAARYVPETNHSVASLFWEFMGSTGAVFTDGELGDANLFENPFYATGFPITEAYWTTVTVGGSSKDVLAQCFQRRCLTYTPDNPEGWRVEAGNVGRHYFQWRYGTDPIAPSS